VAVGDSDGNIVRSSDNGSSFDNVTSPVESGLLDLNGVGFLEKPLKQPPHHLL